MRSLTLTLVVSKKLLLVSVTCSINWWNAYTEYEHELERDMSIYRKSYWHIKGKQVKDLRNLWGHGTYMPGTQNSVPLLKVTWKKNIHFPLNF